MDGFGELLWFIIAARCSNGRKLRGVKDRISSGSTLSVPRVYGIVENLDIVFDPERIDNSLNVRAIRVRLYLMRHRMAGIDSHLVFIIANPNPRIQLKTRLYISEPPSQKSYHLGMHIPTVFWISDFCVNQYG
jgi:hypothetical protein